MTAITPLHLSRSRHVSALTDVQEAGHICQYSHCVNDLYLTLGRQRLVYKMRSRLQVCDTQGESKLQCYADVTLILNYV